MGLIGTTNEEKIWNYLIGSIGNEYGVAGLMGNLYSESGLRPNNLQNTFEKSLNMSDLEYTEYVDTGVYTNFVYDKAGYGLAQWTYWNRKQNLLNFAKDKKVSIGDLEMQLEFLMYELNNSYRSVLESLKNASSIQSASNSVLLGFEKPKDQSESVQNRRYSFSKTYYDMFHKDKEVIMSNSSLVSMAMMSPNHSGKRNHTIDRITPHCFVGQVTVKRGLEVFVDPTRKASCNYVIAKDGKIGLCVDEANRSWCTSNKDNDHRAITIECASDTKAPYAMTDAVYKNLVELCVDICKRNGKTKLLWIPDKTTALAYVPKSDEMLITVHRWFANKSCPGDWLYNRLGELANAVTDALHVESYLQPSQPVKLYRVQVGAYSIKLNATRMQKKLVNAGFIGAFVTQRNAQKLYKVQVGAYSIKSNAQNILSNLKAKGFDGFIVAEFN